MEGDGPVARDCGMSELIVDRPKLHEVGELSWYSDKYLLDDPGFGVRQERDFFPLQIGHTFSGAPSTQPLTEWVPELFPGE